MDPVTGAALISAGGAVANSLLGGLFGSSSAHYQRVNMREAARLQHEENLYWAEYNTPANQMARLRAAGLNPNLVYGNGADAQFQGSISPSGSAPSMQSPSDFSRFGVDFLTFKRMEAERENINADSKLKDAQARAQELENAERESADPVQMGDIKRQDALKLLELHGNQADKENAEYLLLGSKNALVKLEHDLKEKFGNEMLPLQIKRAEIENSNAQAILDNLPAQLQATLNLTRAQAMQATASASLLRVQSEQCNALIKQLNSTTDLVKRQKITENLRQISIGLDNVAQKLQNQLKAKTLPAEVINSYMSPANVAVRALAGFGIRVDNMFDLLGHTAGSSIESSSPPLLENSDSNYPWYY